LSRKAVHSWVANVSLMTKNIETEVRKWLRQQSKDFYTASFDAMENDGTSISILVEVMSRNKCFLQVRISYVLRFISICDIFTDSPL
jgi:hypothetical protein